MHGALIMHLYTVTIKPFSSHGTKLAIQIGYPNISRGSLTCDK